MKRWVKITLITTGVLFVLGVVIEATKSPEQREADKRQREENARRDDSLKIEEQLASHDTEAYIVSKEHVKARLKFPEEADFPWLPESSTHLGKGVYDVRGEVKAKNAFGVVSKYKWRTLMKYTSGDDHDPKNWQLIGITME